MDYSAYGVLRSVKDSSGAEVGFENATVRSSFTYTGREFEPELNMYYYRARYYDPITGRFLQVDPDPGKLASPNTFLSKYIYAANSPVMFSDPSGQVIQVIFVIAAVVGITAGIISASMNYDAARKAGLNNNQANLSALMAFLFTSAAVAASIINPGASWLFSGLASGATNLSNQLISNGDKWDRVNWVRVGMSAAIGGATAWAFGKLFGKLGVESAVNREILSAPFGAIGGYCIDFGFGPDASYTCGLQTLNPPPKADDPSQPRGGYPEGQYPQPYGAR